MIKRILITGGAGFIGSHLTDALIEKGYKVRILDNLSEQVHGPDREVPTYLNPEAELIIGDVKDGSTVIRSLDNVDAVIHLAARVGVGQSMYQISDYVEANDLGTAVLLEAISRKPVQKLIVASSMSIYGEGLYRTIDNKIVQGFDRHLNDLKEGKWELRDSNDNILEPVPVTESKVPSLSSVYALTKYDQEQLVLIFGKAYKIPVVALRLFNVYGTRQALSNPYTGVLAIFASRLLNGNPPVIYEDGMQRRDFVNVKDVVNAFVLALENKDADGDVFNIGSGNFFTIKDIAVLLAKVLGMEKIKPEIINKYRAGDIRHCYADISKAKNILNYTPKVDIDSGILELVIWLKNQKAADKFDRAFSELETRGLAV
jgi:dTDP-L-rhamnose 4-epimerase